MNLENYYYYFFLETTFKLHIHADQMKSYVSSVVITQSGWIIKPSKSAGQSRGKSSRGEACTAQPRHPTHELQAHQHNTKKAP